MDYDSEIINRTVSGLEQEYPRPVDGERDRLYQICQTGNPEERRSALERLFFGNIKLVIKEANQFLRFKGRLDLRDDCLQELIYSFISREKTYDSSKGQFSTYIGDWTRGKIQQIFHSLQRKVIISIHSKEFKHHLDEAEEKCNQQKLPLTDENILEIMKKTNPDKVWAKDLTLEQLRTKRGHAIYDANVISIDQPSHNNPDETIGSLMEDTSVPNPLEEAVLREREKFFEKYLSSLEKRDEDIMRRRFGFSPYTYEHTYDEIGIIHHISRERVRQVERKIKRNLRPKVTKLRI